jgi:uncharacterized phage protein (TIGR02220 family)
VAARALRRLSDVAGRTFAMTTDIRDNIAALMAQGVSEQDLDAVIVAKAREWRDEARMQHQLKPSVLFTPRNFCRYLIEDVRPGPLMTPDDAWKLVRAEIQRVGAWGRPSLEARLQAAVDRAGWRNLCSAPERLAPGMFMAAYKETSLDGQPAHAEPLRQGSRG